MNRSIKALSAALISAAPTTSAFAAASATAPANSASGVQQAEAPTKAHTRTSAMSRRTVEEMQSAFDTNGTKLAIDGYFGPKARAALIDFQTGHQLKPNGILDHATRQALNLPHWQ